LLDPRRSSCLSGLGLGHQPSAASLLSLSALIISLSIACTHTSDNVCERRQLITSTWTESSGCFTVPLDYDHPEVERIRLYFTRSIPKRGSKGRIIVFHGGPAFPRESIPVGGPLWNGIRSNFEVLYMHQRGAGRSQRFNTMELLERTRFRFFSLNFIVLDMAELHKEIWGDKPAFVFGKSAGGFLALKYGLLYPKLVDGLILAATTSHDGYSRGRKEIQRGFDLELARRFPDMPTREVLVKSLEELSTMLVKPISLEELDQSVFLDLNYTMKGQLEAVEIRQELAKGNPTLLNQRLSTGPKVLILDELVATEIYYVIACRELGWFVQNPGVCLFLGRGQAYDLRPRLEELGTKTLVLGGLYDPILPIFFQDELATNIKGAADLAVFSRSGHMILHEEPWRAARLILGFLGIKSQQPPQNMKAPISYGRQLDVDIKGN
jgi:pimeloyl-ACP methyl ester carboxylesterase